MQLVYNSLMPMCIGLVMAQPDRHWSRTVPELDDTLTKEAQKQDDEATKVFTNTRIETFDGRCLFVEKLSGDNRENLTPVQVGQCNSTNGQGWDFITAGIHIDGPADSTLVVSNLTYACLDYDDRQSKENQIRLYSCGGRADGSGGEATAQLFVFPTNTSDISKNGLKLESHRSPRKCLAAEPTRLGVNDCNDGDSAQTFKIQGNNTAAWRPENDNYDLPRPVETDDARSGNATESADENGAGTDASVAESPWSMPTAPHPPFENSAISSGSRYTLAHSFNFTFRVESSFRLLFLGYCPTQNISMWTLAFITLVLLRICSNALASLREPMLPPLTVNIPICRDK